MLSAIDRFMMAPVIGVPVGAVIAIVLNASVGFLIPPPFNYLNWIAVGGLLASEYYRRVVMAATGTVLETLREMQKLRTLLGPPK